MPLFLRAINIGELKMNKSFCLKCLELFKKESEDRLAKKPNLSLKKSKINVNDIIKQDIESAFERICTKAIFDSITSNIEIFIKEGKSIENCPLVQMHGGGKENCNYWLEQLVSKQEPFLSIPTKSKKDS